MITVTQGCRDTGGLLVGLPIYGLVLDTRRLSELVGRADDLSDDEWREILAVLMREYGMGACDGWCDIEVVHYDCGSEEVGYGI